MASTVNAISAANTASGNAVNTTSQSPGTRSSLRSSVNSKGPDGGRRQSGSPVDAGQRRVIVQKAWTQATNLITQKSPYPQQNGNMPHQKPATSTRVSQKESNTPDSHAHDRLVFLLTSFIGLNAIITTKTGEKFSGVFSSSSIEPSDSSFVLKMVQQLSPRPQSSTNGISDTASLYLGSAPDYSMNFDVKDLADISVMNVSTRDVIVKESSGASTGFRTDSDISGNLQVRERTLKRWEPSGDTDANMTLESTTNTAANWDQFEANERLFGATSSYDENIYTTLIDRSDPSYKQKEAEAARIAREIESTEVDNAHVREERGMGPVHADGQDEEEKYSGVRREEANVAPLVSGQPDKYISPAKRVSASAKSSVAPELTKSTSTVSVQQTIESAAVDLKKTPEVTTKQSQQPTIQAAASPTPLMDSEQQNVPAKTAKRAVVENATANVETEVLDHFRQFANSEKLKMQERRRNQASYDRTVKLNELMKFSKNFKLATPVPRDLIPILAKDPHKQEEIIQKAQKQAEETAAAKAVPVATEQKPSARGPAATTAPRHEVGPVAPSNQLDRQNLGRGRSMYPGGPPTGQAGRVQQQTLHSGRPNSGMLSHRLADNIQQRKSAGMVPVPAPLPIQDARITPSGFAGEQHRIASPNKIQTPTSLVGPKFNARALEFKPNPTASAFTPGGLGGMASPQLPARRRSVSRATSPSAFFGAKKPRPVTERPSLQDQFNPIKRMKKELSEKAEKDYTFNGGIPPAYKTPPTWDVRPGNEEKTYLQMFKSPPLVPSILPQSRSGSNPQIPPQQPLPFPVQQPNTTVSPASGPLHGPHHLPPQQHHGPPHFDDHQRMHISASTTQIFPSPRLQHTHVAYPSPMPTHAQLAYSQPVPQFYVQQNTPQSTHMRHYPGGPQFGNPPGAIGAPMMVQQPSNGPYMNVPQGIAPYTPQVQMYSPSPGHAYSQHAPPQPHSGYPSPSRAAPMMMHQGSQPGQPPQPVMFMSPAQQGQPGYGAQQPNHIPSVRTGYPQQQVHYSSSPHQMHHFPPHQHRTPSNGFNQTPQMAPQMSNQPSPAAAPGSHQPEFVEDVK